MRSGVFWANGRWRQWADFMRGGDGEGGWVALLPVERLNPTETGTFVSVPGYELAIFRVADTLIVTDNACPHAHGNLAGGVVRGSIVACPWHQWQFDLRTAACVHNASVRLRSYEARVRDGVVYARLRGVRGADGV
ncbi:MAG: hypothetical protein CHACPFDD_03771 [Phycisphaerae bacterium]|nr:hypothetical protein [Phycisphaerae bacterium]